VKRGLRTAWTVARRELLTLFDQPTGYILLVVFVAVNDFLCFRQIELYGVARCDRCSISSPGCSCSSFPP